MRDGLLGLRHDAVICCDDDDDDIRHLGSASTHGSKGLVTGSINECELASPLKGHPVGTDVLGDTARLTGDDVGLAYGIEKRGLTVVDMTHHGHYRCARLEILRLILLSLDRLHGLGIDILCLVPILVKDKVDLILLQTLVDGDHKAEIEAVDDDVIDGDVKHLGEVIDGDELGQLELLALALLCSQQLLSLLLTCLALLTAILCCRLAGSVTTSLHGRHSLLDLLLDILLSDLLLLLPTTALATLLRVGGCTGLVVAVVAGVAGVGTSRVFIATVVGVLTGTLTTILLGLLVDVDLIALDPLALASRGLGIYLGEVDLADDSEPHIISRTDAVYAIAFLGLVIVRCRRLLLLLSGRRRLLCVSFLRLLLGHGLLRSRLGGLSALRLGLRCRLCLCFRLFLHLGLFFSLRGLLLGLLALGCDGLLRLLYRLSDLRSLGLLRLLRLFGLWSGLRSSLLGGHLLLHLSLLFLDLRCGSLLWLFLR